jgi:hypothetical protein
MPKRKFFVEYNQPALLEISWSGGWFNLKENFKISYAGQLLATFPQRGELEQGQELQLPDGSTLKVILNSNQLEILHNGKFIQDLSKAKAASLYSFLMAILVAVLGLLTFVPGSSSWNIFLPRTDGPLYVGLVGTSALVFAFAFFLVWWFTRRRYHPLGVFGVYFLILLVMLVFGVAFPRYFGEMQSLSQLQFLIILIWLWACGAELYSLKKQRAA